MRQILSLKTRTATYTAPGNFGVYPLSGNPFPKTKKAGDFSPASF
jgi:hypothetical protein